MAGHLALSKLDEPKIFKTVNSIRYHVVFHGAVVKDFEKFKIPDLVDKKKEYEIMKLSKDYVENPDEVAFMIGKFSLVSMTDQHPSITQDISLECHFEVKGSRVKLINIFWVA